MSTVDVLAVHIYFTKIEQDLLMIGVPTHGIYFGHSMPPHPSKNAQIEYIYKNIIKKYISKFYNNIYIILRI